MVSIDELTRKDFEWDRNQYVWQKGTNNEWWPSAYEVSQRLVLEPLL